MIISEGDRQKEIFINKPAYGFISADKHSAAKDFLFPPILGLPL